jgi:hypothetical protein
MSRFGVAIVVVTLVASCGEDESTPQIDAPASTIDAAAGGGGVVCEIETTSCPLPAQVCCDVDSGPDTCIASGTACAGRPLACDGPEDCSGQECCLFDDRSECLDTGICGTTGVISEVMCHRDTDCDTAAGESCCGISPGPVVDLYSVCRIGGCPQ